MIPANVALAGFILVSLTLVGLGAFILWHIVHHRDLLSGLLTERRPYADDPTEPKGSLSRLQFLLFSFVVAALMFLLSVESGAIVDVPVSALVLVGISATTYLISKALTILGRAR